MNIMGSDSKYNGDEDGDIYVSNYHCINCRKHIHHDDFRSNVGAVVVFDDRNEVTCNECVANQSIDLDDDEEWDDVYACGALEVEMFL